MTRDQDFLRRTQKYLDRIPDAEPPTWHTHSRDVLKTLLEVLNQDLRTSNRALDVPAMEEEDIDCFLMNDAAALELVNGDHPIPVPIFTTPTKLFSGITKESPASTIDQMLEYIPSREEEWDVQIGSDLQTKSEPGRKSFAEIQTRFDDKSNKPNPWNILGPESPLPINALPEFLGGQNCALLSDIARLTKYYPVYAFEEQKLWEEYFCDWRRRLSFILLAEGGALTTPHQDGCGLGTWFTCYQGEIGFAWLVRPTEEELAEWRADPDGYQEGRWCLKVMRPGDTMYFDPGLVHFVFRTPGHHGRTGQTMALGGHVLRKSVVGSWAEVTCSQLEAVEEGDGREAPFPFNETIDSLLGVTELIHGSVIHLIKEYEKSGRLEAFGDEDQREKVETYFPEMLRLLRRCRKQRKVVNARKPLERTGDPEWNHYPRLGGKEGKGKGKASGLLSAVRVERANTRLRAEAGGPGFFSSRINFHRTPVGEVDVDDEDEDEDEASDSGDQPRGSSGGIVREYDDEVEDEAEGTKDEVKPKASRPPADEVDDEDDSASPRESRRSSKGKRKRAEQANGSDKNGDDDAQSVEGEDEGPRRSKRKRKSKKLT